MTTKLISMNVGIQLTLLVDGKEKVIRWSVVCPSPSCDQPYWIPILVQGLLSDALGIDILNEEKIEIAKPKRLKPHKTVSQEEFNRKIKEMGYETN